MTTDERLEHFAAGWREESRRELAEHRELWRDTQRQLLELARRMTDLSERMLVTEERLGATRQDMASGTRPCARKWPNATARPMNVSARWWQAGGAYGVIGFEE